MNNGKRHPLSLKCLVRRLRQEGKTHREISKICAISLGSAALWTVGIAITKEQREEIERRRNRPIMTPAIRERFRENAKKHLKKAWDANTYSRQELLQKIVDFYNREGRIPLKREFNMYREYKKRFGAWNKAIREAGFSPNKVIFSKKFTALDGHICDSFAEKIIDDYLTKHHILHGHHVPYGCTKMSADFKIGNILIEYFGLAGVQKNYDRLIRAKRDFCRETGCNLLEIYPNALFAPGFEGFFVKNLKRLLRETKNISVGYA